MENKSLIVSITPFKAQQLINKESNTIVFNKKFSSKKINKIYLYLSNMQIVPYNLRDKVEESLIEKCGLVFAEIDGFVHNNIIYVDDVKVYDQPKHLSEFSRVVKIQNENVIKCLKDNDYPKGYMFVV